MRGCFTRCCGLLEGAVKIEFFNVLSSPMGGVGFPVGNIFFYEKQTLDESFHGFRDFFPQFLYYKVWVDYCGFVDLDTVDNL